MILQAEKSSDPYSLQELYKQWNQESKAEDKGEIYLTRKQIAYFKKRHGLAITNPRARVEIFEIIETLEKVEKEYCDEYYKKYNERF